MVLCKIRTGHLILAIFDVDKASSRHEISNFIQTNANITFFPLCSILCSEPSIFMTGNFCSKNSCRIFSNAERLILSQLQIPHLSPHFHVQNFLLYKILSLSLSTIFNSSISKIVIIFDLLIFLKL